MSIKYINKCFESKHFQPLEKWLLMAMSDNANEDGFCYPSYKNLIERTGMSRATVSKHLKTLKFSNTITVKSHAEIGQGKKVNTYQINKYWLIETLKTDLIEARNNRKVQALNHMKSLRVKHPKSIGVILDTISSRVILRKVQALNQKSIGVIHEPPYNHHIEPPLIKSKPKKKVANKRFKKPTHNEIKEYLQEKQQTMDIDYFIDYYENKEWKIGKVKMKSWKLAVNNWLRNNKKFNPINNKKELNSNFSEKEYKTTPIEELSWMQ